MQQVLFGILRCSVCVVGGGGEVCGEEMINYLLIEEKMCHLIVLKKKMCAEVITVYSINWHLVVK